MKAKARKVLLWALAVWFAAAMVALSPKFVALHRQTRSLERTFTEYTGSLVGQRFDEAYEQCGTDFRRAMPYDQFVRLYKSLQDQYGPLKSAKRVAYEVHGRGSPMFWRGVIDADFAYEKKTLRFEFVFHKEGDRWVLFGAEQL
jgi:hypothetical protein